MIVAWASPRLSLAARVARRFDPGTGPDRYRRARDWLDGSGERLALAAFTFDLEEPGSLVVTPGEPVSDPNPESPSGGREQDDGRHRWEQGFVRATHAIAKGRLEKVVLARRVECRFERPVDPFAVWTDLAAGNPGTYPFLIGGLVGASPELLVGVDQGRVESLALAGTAGSARDLHGEKVDLEHTLAADSVESALMRHADGVRSNRATHRFGDLVHTGTRFVGHLKAGSGVLDLVADLHPTAAVAGTPREAAVDLIRELEDSRGLYAGPVGWFDAEGNGEFAIALRCGRVADDRVVLWAGGGLVAGSDREQEWAETELKLAPMRRALHIQG